MKSGRNPHGPKRRLQLASIALAIVVAAGCGREPATPIERAMRTISTERIASHGEALSRDAFGGRHHASPEADSAAAFLAARLRDLGFPMVQRAENVLGSHPAAFAHHFSVTLFRLGPRSQLRAIQGALERDAEPGPDFVPLVFSRSGLAEGRVVRVDPDADELPPLAGAVALVDVAPRPAEPIGDATLYAWAHRLQDRGAVGVLFAGEMRLLNTPAAVFPTHLAPEQRAAVQSPRGAVANLHPDRLSLASQAETWRDTGARIAPVAVVRSSWADRIRDGDRVRLEVDLQPEVSLGQNVLVGFRGHGRPHEVVVVGAHYDHAGINTAGEVLNGANDNVSGVAALLEIAAALVETRDSLDRSVLLVFFGASRVGLQGSDMLLHDLPMLLGAEARAVSMTALRAIGHDDGNPILVVGSPNGAAVAAAFERYDRRDVLLGPVLALRRVEDDGIAAPRLETMPSRGSDHWNFARAGIPSVLLTDGMEATPLAIPEDDWRNVDVEKVARVARMVVRGTLDLATTSPPMTLPAATGVTASPR